VLTLTVLRRLDGRRKGIVVQFLAEAGLISHARGSPKVRLEGADLRGTIVRGHLGGADPEFDGSPAWTGSRLIFVTRPWRRAVEEWSGGGNLAKRMAVTLFTDLNCPFCYATEQRLEQLGVSERITWRGVEHEPELPVPMALDDLDIAAELAEEVRSVRARAPEVAIALPPGKANTGAGLLATAAALRIDAVRGADFRHAVYRAFWRDGRDVSDPVVLEALARDQGFRALGARPEDAVTVASWRLEWERSPLQGVPLLIREDGETVYGLKDMETLASFVRVD
jgi:predicted DsbA family dithiol-disulfide isomerase